MARDHVTDRRIAHQQRFDPGGEAGDVLVVLIDRQHDVELVRGKAERLQDLVVRERDGALHREHGRGDRVSVQHGADRRKQPVELAMQQRLGAGLGPLRQRIAGIIDRDHVICRQPPFMHAAAGDRDGLIIDPR
jgi:hypothetical protein